MTHAERKGGELLLAQLALKRGQDSRLVAVRSDRRRGADGLPTIRGRAAAIVGVILPPHLLERGEATM
jgi:hypothetical protein